jgi:hypothetical protein
LLWTCKEVWNQELDGATLVLEHGCEVARVLGDPAPDRVLGHTSEEDLASLEIDEEQDIDLSKAHGVDGEEVARERAGSLGAKELCPRRTRSAWCRFEAMTSKHVPDTRRRDGDAELSTFANDAEIAPPRVLASETNDELNDLVIECVVGTAADARERPVPSHELAMPTQQRRGCDEECSPAFRGSSFASVASTARSVGEKRGRATWRCITESW